jgi:hypothetical protein
MSPIAPPSSTSVPLLSLEWDSARWNFDLNLSVWLALGFLLVFGMLAVWHWRAGGWSFRSFEIDQAEIGVGKSKFKFRPNVTDRQVAYAIWVELSTRKIGLPIDLDHDVISEIYDSWYNFFSVTRDLVKGIPVTQIKRDSTQAIIKLSIEVLNEGLRPHLTRWQARFRTWYDRELKRYEEEKGEKVLDPQQMQAKFPQYVELKEDMLRVNQLLIRYHNKMRELIFGD